MTEEALIEGGQLVDHREGRDVVLKLRGVRTQFGTQVVHNHLDFDVFRGEIVGLVGGSGTGKSVLLRTIVVLNQARRGKIEVLGIDPGTRTVRTRFTVDPNCGFLSLIPSGIPKD